ncbi:hypothetical protein [Coralliovum pocilloporae]|uniref:hypothetical protein n=1 Tax=Coralliovum pocilloporae TaxID=3066369 RepID=UPI0033074BA7
MTKAIGKLNSAIESAGVTLVESDSFADMKRIVSCMPEKRVTQQADNKFFDFTSDNGFWIGAFDGEGKCVSVQAARLDCLGRKTLSEYWNEQQPRLYGGRIGKRHAIAADQITGRVVYHGDYWIDRSIRGGSVSVQIAQLGYLMALINFDCDYLYGLMATKGVHVGFHSRVGYTHAVPHGTDWELEPEGISSEDWLVWMDKANMYYLAEIIDRYGAEHNPYTQAGSAASGDQA